jgi:hypothetical protein
MVFIISALCLWLAGCASKDVPVQVKSGVTADQLDYYTDPFDTPKRDLWEIAAFSRTAQLRNFEMAEVSFENGRLKIKTRTGAFSGAVVTSRFQINGDFDIQIDCQIQFLTGKHDVDHVILFGLLEKGETLWTGQYAWINIVKTAEMQTGIIAANQRRRGEIIRGRNRQIKGFQGTLRLVRAGNRISVYYRKQSSSGWIKLDTLSFTSDDVAVMLVVQNYKLGRQVLNAPESVTGFFDNFKINAATRVIEEEI